MKILMTGATGWVGRTLGVELVRRGHELTCLVRNTDSARLHCPFPAKWIHWPTSGTPAEDSAFEGIDAVLHLSGEPIAKTRWTSEVKKNIYSSRVDSTRNLALQVKKHKISTFISASAIGYYGDRSKEHKEDHKKDHKEEELYETSQAGKGFLAEVCEDWEKELFSASSVARCVAVRIGIVIGRGGGALEKMMTPFMTGVGGSLGSGAQWMSWIHLSDLHKLFIACLENPAYQGPINATAPTPVKQIDFAQTLSSVLGKPCWVPTPAFALKLLLGEMSQIVLSSAKVSSRKAIDLGFAFEFKDLESALLSLLKPEQDSDSYLEAQQFVPASLDTVFPFYADEQNLERITPSFLNFKVQGKSTAQIKQGTLIDYRLSVHGVPVNWRTLILEWKPPYLFIDTQLKGPYKKWHHTHHFEKLAHGTLITDEVRYRLPLGKLGSVVAGWKVNSDVQAIFNHRRKVIAEEFGTS